MSYNVQMLLGGVTLGANFPLYSKSFEYIRGDDQGAAIKKIHVTLSGFLEGTSNEDVMYLYSQLKALVGKGDSVLEYRYIDDALILPTLQVHDSQPCFIESYNEPVDNEYGKAAVGEYSISVYWFEEAAENNGLVSTYVTTDGTYTFPKTPRWGRKITVNRDSYRAIRYGSSAEITLEGTLKADNHSALKTLIDNLTNAFSKDGVLAYGAFSQSVRVVGLEITPATLQCYSIYRITLGYDIGSIVKLSRKVNWSRLHLNPVITEQPYCDNRLIEFMNASAQIGTYTFSITASDITTCRTLLATEVVATIIVTSDMFEMPGGSESWDHDNMKVDLTAIKFYPTPVVTNLPGS